VAQQRKTPADYGQLSLFADDTPDWLQAAEPVDNPDGNPPHPPAATTIDDDDDLGQFNLWLRQKVTTGTSRE
jgi:hypothetical protein